MRFKLFFTLFALGISLGNSFVKECNAQTVAAPVLTCVTTDFSSGDVTINWNTPTDSCGPFIGYVLYASSNGANGPFFIVDTFFNPNSSSYLHININATILDWYYFMITLRDCPGAIVLSSDTVLEEPLIGPELDLVTVVPTGVELSWQPSPSQQTSSYLIYRFLSGIGLFQVIDTVFGRLSSNYIDLSAKPDTGFNLYTIAAVDPCGNKTPFSDFPHNNIYLSFEKQTCQQSVLFSWNSYINWNPDVMEYRILVTEDGGPSALMATVDKNTLSITQSMDIFSGTNLCFMVEAIHPDNVTISQSNEICIIKDFVQSTTFNQVVNVSVSDPATIQLQWMVDTSADLSGFAINRGILGDPASFTTIENIGTTQPAPLIYSYDDITAVPGLQEYYYQVVSSDQCGFTLESSLGNSIHLTGRSDPFGINHIEWNPYDIKGATLFSYVIYRKVKNNYLPITSVGPGQLSYDDDVSSLFDSGEEYCYYVETEYNLRLDNGFSMLMKSRSNELCLSHEPIVRVPTAFTPLGYNPEFKPVCAYCDGMDYQFMVFNRAGAMLFETNDLKVGWDGTYKGEIVPQGGYPYLIKLNSAEGLKIEEKGVVVLLR